MGRYQHTCAVPFDAEKSSCGRSKYREQLAWIWSYFCQDEGQQAGYEPDPNINDPSLFPPHNPFKGLNVTSTEYDLNNGVVVTGTPSIGKSLFLLFVLTLRLLAKQTTVFHCHMNEFLIFDETGVYKSQDMVSELRFLPEHTWFLVDSNQSITSPPPTFLGACTSYCRKIVVAASPRRERFDWKSKYPSIIPVWCDIFTFDEMLKARDAQWGKGRVPELQLQSFCNNYGGIARSAFKLSKKPNQHERDIKQNLDSIPWETLENSIRALNSGFFDIKFSNNIVVSRPDRDGRDEFYCKFASPKVAGIVVDSYAKRSHANAVQLYRYFLSTPRTRACAGYLLESVAFTELEAGGFWRIQRMKEKPGGRTGFNANETAWMHDEFGDPWTLSTGWGNKSVIITEGFSLYKNRQKKYCPVHCVTYDPGGKQPVPSGPAMYVPKTSNNPSFDAWFHEPTSTVPIVVIQATVQTTPHEINPKVLDFFRSDVILLVLSDNLGGQTVFTSKKSAKKIKAVYRMVYT